MIRPSPLTLGLLMGMLEPELRPLFKNNQMSFEQLEAEYSLIQQKKSSLSFNKRCEIEYQYERILKSRNEVE